MVFLNVFLINLGNNQLCLLIIVSLLHLLLPSPIPSMSGSWYFVVFVDDYSCYTLVFLMKSRYELLDIYRNFAKMVET
jgi:hypothetical protein